MEISGAGLFHVYAVRQADEALSLLVGEPAGAPDAKGRFPDGSVNARVAQRLKETAERELEDELAGPGGRSDFVQGAAAQVARRPDPLAPC